MTMPVADVATDHVLGVLRPIWATRTETATRLRERIEAVLDHAVTLKNRPADVPNPARWKGHLSNVLPRPKKITPVEHHAALPWKEAPAFFAKLRETLSAGSLALQWLILSATRANETAGAEWSEINLQAKTWTIPGSRTKTGKEHIVPITSRMMAILEMLPRRGTHLFPGNRGRASLNPESLRRALQRDMGRADLTVHGWRSTFRDWALENGHSREIAELSLAHTSGNAVEDAYRRGTALQLRAVLMQAWTDYLLGVQP
jgi:integrase